MSDKHKRMVVLIADDEPVTRKNVFTPARGSGRG